MGCGASQAAVTTRSAHKESAVGLPISAWTEQDVSIWLDACSADLQKYRSALLPATGHAVAQWTHAELVGKGLCPADAARLLAYRDTAAAVTVPRSPLLADGVGGAQQGAPLAPPATCSSDEDDAGEGATTTTAASEEDVVPGGNGEAAGTAQSQIAKIRKKQAAQAMLTKGLQLTRATIAKIGPMLPFPGAEAASLVVTLMDVVETAITNHSNLRELQQRAVALLDILLAYHTDLMAVKKYKGVVDEFQDVLQGVIAYARSYGERNCLMRLLTGGNDKDHYEELVARMVVLCERMMLAVAVDSNARVQELQRLAEQSLGLLQQVADYQDPSSGAYALVSELGGLEAVLADGDKLGRVMQRLDVSARVTIQVVSSLLSSQLDTGPQRHIRQPELRLFWKHTYGEEGQVPWYVFWQDFPELLRDTPADAAMVSELGRLLAQDAAQAAFQRAVERDDELSVSVWELQLSFNDWEGLTKQVGRMLFGADGAGEPAGMPASVEGGAQAGGSRVLTDDDSSATQPAACLLAPSKHRSQLEPDVSTTAATVACREPAPGVAALDMEAAANNGEGGSKPAGGGGLDSRCGAGRSGRKAGTSRLVDALGKGARVLRAAIEKVGPSLPFPGSQAAVLVVTLMDVVETAITNHSNLRELQQRAVALLDILLAYHTDLMAVKKYKGVVDEFQDVLQGVIAYARGYGERNCLMRLLTGGSDKDHFEELVARMVVLCERMMLAVAVDSNARVQELQRLAEQSLGLLQRAAEYQDPSMGARALVSELGGLEAVLADGDKLGRVMQRLDVSARVTIQVISSLLASHLDSRSPQRHIRQPDLRLFWKHQYAGVSEVPWYNFWEHFPLMLKDTPADAAMVSELGQLLADVATRGAFEQAISRRQQPGSSVSVWELRAAFRGDDGLLAQVARLLPGGPLLPPVAVGARPLQSVLPASGAAAPGSGGRCQLPPLVANYVGRVEDAGAIMMHLQTRGSLVLVAPGGMGKSCLAADVGWRLMNGAAGVLRAALWVDLREANSLAEVEGRFCATLGLQLENTGNAHRILAAFKALADSAPAAVNARQQSPGDPLDQLCGPMVALVVVDNAEDALLQTEAAETLRNLLGRVVREAIGVRLLVTSRVPISQSKFSGQPDLADLVATRASSPVQLPLLVERNVGVISRDEAVHLVLAIAADLTEPEAAAVSASCNYMPLLLCLVAEAMLAGRLTLKDLPKRQEQEEGSCHQAITTDTMDSTVRLVLSSLRKQHQQALCQLTLFPSAFNLGGAAAILGTSEPQAWGLLAVLYSYSAVQRAGPRRTLCTWWYGSRLPSWVHS